MIFRSSSSIEQMAHCYFSFEDGYRLGHKAARAAVTPAVRGMNSGGLCWKQRGAVPFPDLDAV